MSSIPSLMALRCLDASARHRSFTKAADEVHLTQGAVSHQILGLEEQLGVQLFVRRRAGLVLTAPGQTFWNEISAALRQIERAAQNLRTHKGLGGTLNLCVASSFATYWLMPRLGDFVARHPEVTLNLSTHIGPVDFANAPHDAAIEYCEGPATGIHAHQVWPLALSPWCAPALLKGRAGKRTAGPVTRARLAALLNGHALLRHTTVPQAWTQWLSEAGMAQDVAPAHLRDGPQYDLLSMALNGAIAGLGVALLPDYMAQAAAQSGQIVQLSPVTWTSGKAYYLRFPDWKASMPPLQKFVQWLAGPAAISPR